MKIYVISEHIDYDHEVGHHDTSIICGYSSLDLAKKHLESIFQEASIQCKEHNDKRLEYGWKADWKMPDDNDWSNDQHRVLDLSGMCYYVTDYYRIDEIEVKSQFDEQEV